MALRPKRRSRTGFTSNAADPKMTPEEYHLLIGQHEHIEHKALRHEVAKEFAKIQRKPCIIESNEFLHPKQPPPLPLEGNHKDETFRRSTAWPAYSIIQRAAHMLCYSLCEEHTVIQYLQKLQLPQEKINIAKKVYALMVQSTNYWRKLNYITRSVRVYKPRYNAKTRKYALKNAQWPLQIAMTLVDFHLDHIVDIVYQKPIWSSDHDEYTAKQQQERIQNDDMLHCSDSGSTYDDDEHNSEEEPIANKVADHMSRSEFDDIQAKVKQQNNQSLEDLFGTMFSNVATSGQRIAFADNFETDLNESDHQNENEEEKAEFETKKEDTPQDKLIYEKTYPKFPEFD